MGGSKDFMPVKKEVRSRQEESMNKACMDWVYDKIVDHESAFFEEAPGVFKYDWLGTSAKKANYGF